MNSDSFQVDMEPFSYLSKNDAAFNSRLNIPRSFSRKGEEKKMSNPSVDNERDAIFSPKELTGTTEPQSHHQISIITSAVTATGTPTKSTLRSSSFKQTSIISPRRILFFFATLSSMGTILLIYFTLSIAKHCKDNNLHD